MPLGNKIKIKKIILPIPIMKGNIFGLYLPLFCFVAWEFVQSTIIDPPLPVD
jgi:hypothetical protein